MTMIVLLAAAAVVLILGGMVVVASWGRSDGVHNDADLIGKAMIGAGATFGILAAGFYAVARYHGA